MRTPRNEGVKLVKGGTVLSIYQSREYERPVGWNHLYVVGSSQGYLVLLGTFLLLLLLPLFAV